MMNWSFNKYGWSISWFNIKNLSEEDYYKKYNQGYQENGKSYFKKIFHFLYKEYGVEFVHIFDHSHILWETPRNIYWLIFRKSSNYSTKGRLCFKLMKTSNYHIGCS